MHRSFADHLSFRFGVACRKSWTAIRHFWWWLTFARSATQQLLVSLYVFWVLRLLCLLPYVCIGAKFFPKRGSRNCIRECQSVLGESVLLLRKFTSASHLLSRSTPPGIWRQGHCTLWTCLYWIRVDASVCLRFVPCGGLRVVSAMCASYTIRRRNALLSTTLRSQMREIVWCWSTLFSWILHVHYLEWFGILALVTCFVSSFITPATAFLLLSAFIHVIQGEHLSSLAQAWTRRPCILSTSIKEDILHP